MPASGGEASEFERLKTLLFRPESDRLSAAERQLQDLRGWIGDPSRLESATAQVLIEAFRRAEVARHRELAMAVAPVVVAAIHSEIQNSRDKMVEALYPITGRLVAAAVAAAIRDLSALINQRLEIVSFNHLRLRFRAAITGRSVAEIALAEARDGSFARILLLERGSGRLLAHWRPVDAADDNPDLISGLIAAISEFAAAVLADKHGELRTLDLGTSQVFLRASSRVILAAETLGAIGARQRLELEAGFLALVERHDRGETLGEADLAALAPKPQPTKAKRSRKARFATFAIIGVLALVFALRGPVHRWLKNARIEAARERALADDPALANYPLTITEDWKSDTVIVRGLAGAAEPVDRLVADLGAAAAPMKVVSQVEILATHSELADARAALARDAAALAKFQTALDARAAATAARDRRDDADRATLESQGQALRADIANIQAALSEPRRVIADAASRAVVLFGERDALADPTAAAKTLDALAEAIRRTGVGARVIGYADESGTAAGNVEFSRARAAKAAKMLVERGVTSDKLVVVGRGAQNPIADAPDPHLRNRRVTFEPLYPDEPAP
jgi:outer membrane protein OmpA-like peptidoglycan-associated protein